MFKVGDRVRYVRGAQGRYDTNWAQRNDLKKGKIYTVSTANHADVKVRPQENGEDYWVSKHQFDYAKLTNEERMAERRKELT